MKSTGIVRKIDELGRIVLPVELRRSLNIEQRDAVEIYVDNNLITAQMMQGLYDSAELGKEVSF